MDIDISQKNLCLAEKIVSKANMSTRPAYYSGRGALFEDFNWGKPSLNIIFEELNKVDEKYALAFIDFVMAFDNLNATDFLAIFYSFAKNSFSLENLQIVKSGYNLEADTDEQRDALAFATIFSAFGNSRKRDDTVAIKNKFLNGLPENILERPEIKEYIYHMRNKQQKVKGIY